jgi:hypothetical protein
MRTDLEQMLLPRDKAPETRERYIISSEKLMVSIAWNPDGFHVIEVLAKGHKSDADFYCSSMRTKPSRKARQFRNETQRELILHTDNVRPQTAKSGIEFCAKRDPRVAPHLVIHRTRHRPITVDLATSRTN